MDYMEKIDKLLEENLTEISFRLWKALKEKIPDIWTRPSSSSGKYHRRKDSTIPSIAEHTWEMLKAGIKLLSIFNLTSKVLDSDIIILSIALHDSSKYGDTNPTNVPHTNGKHDKIIADKIVKNKDVLLRIFDEKQISLLENCVRFHSGRWSTDWNKDLDFDKLPTEVLFLHFLDMCSTHNILNTETD
jgi:hypothetical protein